jgi:hypothetical protein
MKSITLILSILAVLSLVCGVVSTLVVKTEITANWKRVGKVLIWIIGLLIFRLVIWGFTNPWSKDKTTPKTEMIGGIPIEKPTTEWTFIWNKGRKEVVLDVEITKNNEQLLHAVLHDKDGYGQDVSVGGLTLNWVNGDLIGTWQNYLDGDRGECFLYKRADWLWSGHYTLQDGSRTDCSLKVK